MNGREQFIYEIAKGNVSDEAVIKYCKEAIQDKADLQGFVIDLEKASRNSAYRQQGYLSNAIEAICKYLGVSSVFEIQEVNLKEMYETALKRSEYTDKEKEQQALLHKIQEQTEPQPIKKPRNADEVLKHMGLNMRFGVIAMDKTKTASTLEELLERACKEPVANGVVITRKAFAKGLKESLVDWITADGNRALYKYCLKKSSFKNIAPDAKRLADAIEDRAVEWLASVREASTIVSFPKELDRPEAKDLLQRLVEAGFCKIDFSWNKGKTNYQATICAHHISIIMWGKNKWKPFETLWQMCKMAQTYNRIPTDANQESIKEVDKLFPENIPQKPKRL